MAYENNRMIEPNHIPKRTVTLIIFIYQILYARKHRKSFYELKIDPFPFNRKTWTGMATSLFLLLCLTLTQCWEMFPPFRPAT